MMQSTNQDQLRGAYAALDEVHASVRSYDTKAQVMGIGFIFSLGVIFNILEGFDMERTLGPIQLAAAFVLSIGPVILYGMVLYPTRKLFNRFETTDMSVQHSLYYLPKYHADAESYLQAIKSTDWLVEVAYEVVKVSALRDEKRKHFIRALYASGVSFSVLMGSSLLKLIGVG